MPQTLVYLVRHGESAGNVDPSLPRGDDPPLTARGRTQASLAAKAIAPLGVEAFFSSPLRRARETAEQLAAGAEIGVLDGFGEVDMGTLADARDGAGRAERDAIFAAWLAGDRSRTFPGGEDFPAIARRVAEGLQLASARHHVVAVVTHRMAIAAAASLCTAPGVSPTGPCANGSITSLRRAGESWELVAWGDARHLA